MAQTREGSVVRFDTNDTTYDNAAKLKICGFKLVGGADASTAIVKDTDTNGQILWQGRAGANADCFEQINIRCDKKIHVTLTGTGPILYVYTE